MLAGHYRRKHPNLKEEESLILAEMDIHANKVPELDPLGRFRGVYERSKADPRPLGEQFQSFMFKACLIGFGIVIAFDLLVRLIMGF